jgi:hypothetical protein
MSAASLFDPSVSDPSAPVFPFAWDRASQGARNREAPVLTPGSAPPGRDIRFNLSPTPLSPELLALGGGGQPPSPDAMEGVNQSQTPVGSLSFALGTTQTTQTARTATQNHPAYVDYNAWVKQSSSKDPKAWSLVWDSQVTEKKTWVDNYVSGTPVYYSFDIKDSQADYAKSGYLRPMTEDQKTNARKALQELSNATGVTFVEKPGSGAGMVLAQADLSSGDDKYSTMGQHMGTRLNSEVYQHTLMVNFWEYKDKPLTPGTSGYETLLHELGHAAGLDDAKFDLAKKYENLDNTKYTLMSYNGDTNATKYAELDKRAFSILYPPELKPKPKTPLTMMAGVGGTSAEIAPQSDPYYDEAGPYDDDLDEIDVADAHAVRESHDESGSGTAGEGGQEGAQRPVEDEQHLPEYAGDGAHGGAAEEEVVFRLSAAPSRLEALPGPMATPSGLGMFQNFSFDRLKHAEGLLA